MLAAVNILFSLSLLSGLAILTLGLYSLFKSDFNFWPPPSSNSWQKKMSWFLFRVFVYPLFIIVLLNLKEISWGRPNTIAGGLIFVSGIYFAFKISFQLGLKNTYGDSKGLVTKGWFSKSRNPVYTSTIIALLGLMIFSPNFEVLVLSTIWIVIYLLLPFVEEIWLEKNYGEEYLEYKKRVRRFL